MIYRIYLYSSCRIYIYIYIIRLRTAEKVGWTLFSRPDAWTRHLSTWKSKFIA